MAIFRRDGSTNKIIRVDRQTASIVRVPNSSPRGPQGPQGIQGEQGETGPANTLSIGTVEDGGAAAATITGDAPNQTLNLVLPKGPQGEQGVQGDPGDEVELQKSATHIQWRYVGDAEWNDLVALADLKGDKGDKGDTGAAGSDGSDGADGNTVLSGSDAPSSSLGVDGDFYIDTTSKNIYGPKTAGAWGSPTSLIGPAGEGSGDMLASVYDPSGIQSDVYNTDFHVDGTNNKVFTAAEKTKLAGVESGATADQTGAEIKAAYEAEDDTNAFTDAEKSKLAGIEAGAEVNEVTQADLDAVANAKANASHTHSVTDLTATGGSSTSYLRKDNTWSTPTNTTYEEITTAEIDAGTASTLRTITGRRVQYIIDKITIAYNAAISAAIGALTKASVGLSNVDNTSDLDKPVSMATQDVIDGVAMELEETSNIPTASSSAQGVTFDGTHYYFSENTMLYKYAADGTLVTSRNVTSDGVSVGQIAGLCVANGIVYAACSQYPASPRRGAVKEYNASDLSYRNVEYVLEADNVMEGVYWDGEKFWTCTNEDIVRTWDPTFTTSTTYTPDFTTSPAAQSHGWQGIVYKDGHVYLNTHEKSVPDTIQKFRVEGTNLKLVAQYQRPKYCTQDFDIDGDTFIMAKRSYVATTGISDAIVLAKLTPLDYRQNTIVFKEDFTQRSITGTNYVEDTNLVGSIVAKKDDIIKVTLEGNFFVTSGFLRAYLAPASTNSLPLTAKQSARTMRSATTGTEGHTLTQSMFWRADATGKATFSMLWRAASSGTAYVDDRVMTLQIVGKDTDAFQ